ncbi:hypothetical protein P7L53_12090 [Thermoleptolyngbya sichuanensis XZ-Cy5]|uniref:hypothetical protein n=1 Tax=Thermoleptolyngbya sichuanensis TaxID=2885951 RepID=UPI00240D7E19|nr:hypothetical protein [Thermoleptolyngbya sichuanensis]MDG2616980.1 hypothetical protein [Thermoleptolyngbya sichuanensis XZ-Cy5]
MDISLLSPGQQYDLLAQSAEMERAIAAYQLREGIPSTVNSPQQLRPPPPGTRGLDLPLAPLPPDPNATPPRPDLLQSRQAQDFQEILRNTRRRNYADFKRTLSEATPSQLRLIERYLQESTAPDFLSNRVTQEVRARGLQPQTFSEAARPNPTPPTRPPSGFTNQPPPTSLDNSPALRTPSTSGARASAPSALATPRPAQPSHWNLYQPANAPPPPPANRNIPRPPEAPPAGLPQIGARGRMAWGVAGGAADLGLRLAAGQDLGQAAYGAAGGFAGGLAGQGLGQAIGAGLGFAFGGPPGAAAGGFIGGALGGFAGGIAGGQIADRYYPGNNAPLPGTPLPGQIEELPLPRPLAPPGNGGGGVGIPGPAVPFQPRPLNSPPLLGQDGRIGQGIGPYRITYQAASGNWANTNVTWHTVQSDIWGPVTYSISYGNPLANHWRVTVVYHGDANSGRSATPIVSNTNYFVGLAGQNAAPRGFTIQDLSVPGSVPQPALVPNPFAPTPQRNPNQHPNNSPRDQYHPNPLPQAPPSPTGQPTGEPLPGNLGGNEPELQPQRSPDRAQQSPPQSDRALPRAPSPGGVGPGRGNFPTFPGLPIPAPAPLPAQQRARVTVNAQRPQPVTQPRGTGVGNPPPPPTTPDEPCRGNRCAQRQLQGIQNANNRLARLEQALLGGADLGANAAILRKLEQIDAKLGPQLPNGGIGNFLKRLWDNLGIGKILNVLTFITTLHNAKMLSQDIFETLLIAIEQGLSLGRWDEFLKDSAGSRISLSEWLGDQLESLLKSILGDDTVEGIKLKWQRANRIYQAAQNVLFAFQSILFSIQEALEVIGSMIAKIGNALKRYGVVFEKAYEWFNPRPDFSNKWFTRLERAEELANALATVTGSIKEVQESVEYFSQSRQELRQQLEQGMETEERKLPENQPTETAEHEARQASGSPLIEDTDLYPPETDDTP